jgi:hypothetical protein
MQLIRSARLMGHWLQQATVCRLSPVQTTVKVNCNSTVSNSSLHTSTTDGMCSTFFPFQCLRAKWFEADGCEVWSRKDGEQLTYGDYCNSYRTSINMCISLYWHCIMFLPPHCSNKSKWLNQINLTDSSTSLYGKYCLSLPVGYVIA